MVVVVDQATKAWARAALDSGPVIAIDGWLEFRLTENTGAAFSLLPRNGPLLGVVAAGIIVLIVLVLKDAGHRLDAIGLGMILGGAVGNLLDRVLRGDGFLDGGVTDFISVSFFWPVFNVADSAITIGVVLLLVSAFIRR